MFQSKLYVSSDELHIILKLTFESIRVFSTIEHLKGHCQLLVISIKQLTSPVITIKHKVTLKFVFILIGFNNCLIDITNSDNF